MGRPGLKNLDDDDDSTFKETWGG